MAYKVKYEHPQFPTADADDNPFEFGIPGLGRVVNGGTLDIDEEMELAFVAARGMTVEDAFKDSPEMTLSGKSELSAETIAQLVVPPEEETTPVQEVVETAPPAPTLDEGVTTDA